MPRVEQGLFNKARTLSLASNPPDLLPGDFPWSPATALGTSRVDLSIPSVQESADLFHPWDLEKALFPLANLLSLLVSHRDTNFLSLQVLLSSVGKQKPGNPAKDFSCGKDAWNVLSAWMEDRKDKISRRKKWTPQLSINNSKKKKSMLAKYLPNIFLLLAAKSLQSCPTLCDPIDGSPSGSPVPGILQAGTLEWVAISFSSAWKWKVKGKLLSHVQLLATPWTAAYQAPLSMGFSRQEYWSGVPSPSLSFCLGMSIFRDFREVLTEVT